MVSIALKGTNSMPPDVRSSFDILIRHLFVEPHYSRATNHTMKDDSKMPAEREKRKTRKTVQYNDNLLHSEGVRVYHYLFKSLHLHFIYQS